MDKEQGYIYSMLSTAYSANIIKTLGAPKHNTFEYYIERRTAIEPKIEALRKNLIDYNALIELKQEFVLFKGIYIVLHRRYMRQDAEKKQSNEQFAVLRTLPPNDILQIITEAEIIQYEQYFQDHPTSVYLKPKTLFQRRHIYKTLRESTMVDTYKETSIGEYKLKGVEAISDNPNGPFILNMLRNAYSSERVALPDIPEATTFEYYIKCREKIEPYIDAVMADLTDYTALLRLKHKLVTYKAAHAYQNRKYKKKGSKQRRLSTRYPLLQSLSPESIMLLVTKAEITQYDEFFEHHPLAEYVKPKELLNRKKMLKHMREETIVDIYRHIYGANEIKLRIEESLLENPKELYPAARAMNRKFIIHSGMTNTGKTYNAIAALKKADTGAYLGPLRLLAMEIQENLLMDNVMCSMVTGEEENIVPYATHIASTVEMINLYALYDTAVIDECQMIADDERGCAWTRAILGVRAEGIHLCTAPDAVPILLKIIEDCGDEYEIIEYERRTPIEYDASFDTGAEIAWRTEQGKRRRLSCKERLGKIDLDKLEYGDALIAFRRTDVLEIADILRQKGIEASVIYGALPYHTRKQQLKRFMDGDTKVVVATDAIGMGLNLPIRRVIFTTVYKFDGKYTRLLKPSEIKQIAGRAGRKGIYDKGYVYSVAEQEYIFNSLTAEPEYIEKAYIDFDTAFIEIDSDMREILLAWSAAEMPYDIYEKINVNRIMNHIKLIEKLCEEKGYECSKADLYNLATVTFDDTNPPVVGAWMDYVKDYLKGKEELKYPRIIRSSVEKLEASFKKVDMYYSFCRTMGYEPDLDWIENMKAYLSDEINYRLVDSKDKI